MVLLNYVYCITKPLLLAVTNILCANVANQSHMMASK